MKTDLPYEVTETLTVLLVQHPFWASILYDRMEIVMSDDCGDGVQNDTLATDGKTLFINEGYFKSLTKGQRVFAIAHEVCHAMWNHCSRSASYERMGHVNGLPFHQPTMNVAADMSINAMLIADKVGEFKDGWCYSKQYAAGDMMEDIYVDLYKKHPPKPGQGGQGQGQGQGQGNSPNNGRQSAGGHTPQDRHITSPQPSDNDTAEWKRAVKAAAAAAKAQGKLSANLERMVTIVCEPQVPWQDEIRPIILAKIGNDDKSFSRPRRRSLAMFNQIVPGRVSHGSGVLVLVVDTSGSISPDPEGAVFFAEMMAIVGECRPEAVHVVWCDAEVKAAEEVDTSEGGMEGYLVERAKTFPGGGGTDFRPPFKWVEQEGIEPDMLIYFTDMYGPFPDRDPGYDVVWCSTTKIAGIPHKPKFGKVLHVDLPKPM